jgi:chromate transporter
MMGTVTLWSILVVMLVSAFASFGGGAGPMVVIQGTWVKGGQLDPALFAWVIALSHLLPGPRAGFIAGIGYYLHGVSGSVVAMAGVLVPAWVAAAVAVTSLDRLREVVNRLMRVGLYVVAGLVVATAVGMALPLALNWVEIAAVCVVAWLVGRHDVEPLWIICAAMAVGLSWQWLL